MAHLASQVHALNILRHLFLDTNLAKEMAAYVPEVCFFPLGLGRPLPGPHAGAESVGVLLCFRIQRPLPKGQACPS